MIRNGKPRSTAYGGARLVETGESKAHALLGMDVEIDRRDFIAGGLAATCPLSGCSTQPARASSWNGYGGEGDFAGSNGNTESVRDAAHAVRDGTHNRM